MSRQDGDDILSISHWRYLHDVAEIVRLCEDFSSAILWFDKSLQPFDVTGNLAVKT